MKKKIIKIFIMMLMIMALSSVNIFAEEKSYIEENSKMSLKNNIQKEATEELNEVKESTIGSRMAMKNSIQKTFIVKKEDGTELGQFDKLCEAMEKAVREPEGSNVTILQTKDFDQSDDSYVYETNRTNITLKSIDNNKKTIKVKKDRDISWVQKKLTVENIIIDGASRGTAFFVADNGTLILNNCIIKNCNTDYEQGFYHAAIDAVGGNIILNNTIIKDNVNDTPYDRSKFNGTQSLAGAIYMQGTSTLTINGGSFDNNTCTKYGGAIYATSKTKITLDNVKFNNNKADEFGGAIFSFGNVEIKNSSFIGNTTKNSGSGGAIYNMNGLLKINKTSFKSNFAKSGGAINKYKGTSEIEECEFESNISQDGGGIYFYLGDGTIKNSKFNENFAFNVGSAIQFNDSKYILDKINFENNGKISDETGTYLCGNGGAINIYKENVQDTKITIKNSNFKGNICKENGGAIFTNDSSYDNPADTNKYKTIDIDNNTIFEGNKASGYFNPPENNSDFSNLKFKRTSLTGSNLILEDSLLNNYDINYKNEIRIITYDANGGKFADGTTIKSKKYIVGENIKIIEAPKREGYKFLYWKGSEYKPNDNYTVKDHHRFVAQWEEEKKPKPQPEPQPQPQPKPEPKPQPQPKAEKKTYFSFSSVKPIEEIYKHIEYLSGYPDFSVRADANVKRAEAVTMLVRLKGYTIVENYKEIYKDVKEKDWYSKYILTAYREGILEEKEGENFRPNDNMTRAELAQLISHVDKNNSAKAPFTDIEGHKYIEAINKSYGNNRIKGYPDNTFRPDQEITRAETVTMLNNLFDRKVRERGLKEVEVKKYIDLDKNHWAYYEIIEASHTHEYKTIEVEGTEEEWIRIIK